jgi:hypothetical protein
MSNINQHNVIPAEQPHPTCPVCGVAMWMVFLEHIPGTNERLHYECQCDAKAVLSPIR